MPVQQKYADVDEYIASFPEPTAAALRELRAVIHDALPGAGEVISYHMPTFTVGERPVVHLSGYARHVSLYPAPDGDEAFEEAIRPYRSGASTLRFPLAKPLPSALVKQAVELLANR